MDQSTVYWEKFQQMLKSLTNIINRYLQQLLAKMFSRLGIKTKDTVKGILSSTADNLSMASFKRMLDDGPTKETVLLGEFDREETEKIVQLANEKGIKIAITEKYVEDGTNYRYQLSQNQMNELQSSQKAIERNNQKINKISMQNMPDEKKQAKIAKLQEENKAIQNSIARFYEENKHSTYTIMVNASKSEFINQIKNDFLDHDTKETLQALQKEHIERTKYNEVFKDFKDAQQAYETAKDKCAELKEKVDEKQKAFDELDKRFNNMPANMSEKKKNKLTMDHVNAKKELADLKQEWSEAIKMREIAKDAFDKKTFSGEFSLDNIQNSVGNVSLSMDRYDTVNFKEGYSTFSLTSEQYYNMVNENMEKLQDKSYFAFKETKDGPVEIICSTKDTQAFMDYANQYTETPVDVKIHNSNIPTNDTKEIKTWDLPLKDDSYLQTNLDSLERMHRDHNGQYMVEMDRDDDEKITLHVHSTMDMEQYKDHTQDFILQQQKAKEKERDRHYEQMHQHEGEYAYEIPEMQQEQQVQYQDKTESLDIGSDSDRDDR